MSSVPAAAVEASRPAAAAAALSIRGLAKEYVAGKRVLAGITLDFAPRGPSYPW